MASNEASSSSAAASAAAPPPAVPDLASSSAPSSSNAGSSDQHRYDQDKKPPVIIVIGMAGSGKTSLMRQLHVHAAMRQKRIYSVNLDPAVIDEGGFEANIDVRDTVEYKDVMQTYKLGPNGAIMTSLNLFAAQFDQAVAFIEKRAGIARKDSDQNSDQDSDECTDDEAEDQDAGLDYVFVDTPGQIEVFTWSASGTIITETLASTLPTVLCYVVDTPRTTSPITFMSNMLYACSIMYKTRLPFIIVFNKVDVVSHEFAQEWMSDFESFQDALDEEHDQGYMSSLTRSMSLVLDEFYANLNSVGVSAATGEGLDEFFEAVEAAKSEYYETYYPELQAKRKKAVEEELSRQEEALRQLKLDQKKEKGSSAP